MTVLLTGSTGSLGSYLLDSLVRQQHVRKIYCLNRAEDGLARQKMASDDRRLDTTAWGEERVEFLHVDLSLPIFGLSRKKYDQLLQESTHIIRESGSPFLCPCLSRLTTHHTTQTTSGQLTSTGTSPRSSLPYAASGICWTSASTRHSASSSCSCPRSEQSARWQRSRWPRAPTTSYRRGSGATARPSSYVSSSSRSTSSPPPASSERPSAGSDRSPDRR